MLSKQVTFLSTVVINRSFFLPLGTWFGSYANDDSKYSFVGCTVAPGFDFEDFLLGSKSKLINDFPNAKQVIEKLTEGLP